MNNSKIFDFFDSSGKVAYYKIIEYLLNKFDIIYELKTQTFFSYNPRENIWAVLYEEQIEGLVKDILKKYYKSYIGQEIVKQLKAEIPIQKLPEFSFNSNRNILNLNNCAFDLEAKKARPHSRNDYYTFKMPVNFNPSAKYELWEQTLSEIFNDDNELVAIIQEFFGICLTSAINTKYLLLFGDGSNGKDVILYVLRNMLSGKNCSSLSFEELSHQFKSYEIYNKLVNICSELNPKSTSTTDAFKKLVDGNNIVIQKKYQQPFDYMPIAKFIFSSNHLPQTTDNTNGFYRRLLPIPFNVKFTSAPITSDEKLKDIDRKSKLDKELEGILIWSINGLIRLEQNKFNFTTSAASKKLFNEIIFMNNPLKSFISQNIEFSLSSYVEKSVLYDLYKEWSDYYDIGIMFPNDFKKQIFIELKKIYTSKTPREYIFKNIKLKSQVVQ